MFLFNSYIELTLHYRYIREMWTMPLANRAHGQQSTIKFGDGFPIL